MSAPPRAARPGPRSRIAWTGVIVALLAACSSPSASPTDGGGGGDTQISLSGSAFTPSSITVAVDEAIEFDNDDGRSHRIVEGEDGAEVGDPAFTAIELESGERSGPVTFDAPGTYQLTCTIHPSMNMTVTVE